MTRLSWRDAKEQFGFEEVDQAASCSVCEHSDYDDCELHPGAPLSDHHTNEYEAYRWICPDCLSDYPRYWWQRLAYNWRWRVRRLKWKMRRGSER